MLSVTCNIHQATLHANWLHQAERQAASPIALVVTISLLVELSEHKFCALVAWSDGRQQYHERDGTKGIPKHRDLVDHAQYADRQEAQRALGYQDRCSKKRERVISSDCNICQRERIYKEDFDARDR